MELRKDYILRRFVIVSELRGKRPFEFKESEVEDDASKCVFCPGKENETPSEIGHVGEPWNIRWMENKFHALEPVGKCDIVTDNKYFTYSDAYGYHEVIIETNDHKKQLHDLKDFEIKDLLKVYKNRMEDLSAKPHIQYVLIFKNHGKNAGTSLKHSHTQVVAFNHIPADIADKLDAVKNYDACPYCEILNIEKGSDRRCFENNSFVAFAPYASRFNYEIWIFPKKHYTSISEFDDWEFLELAQIIKKIVARLKIMNASYNYFIHYTPKNSGYDKGLHFHFEITPRIETWGGLEDGSGTYVNKISPEHAAQFYRGERES